MSVETTEYLDFTKVPGFLSCLGMVTIKKWWGGVKELLPRGGRQFGEAKKGIQSFYCFFIEE